MYVYPVSQLSTFSMPSKDMKCHLHHMITMSQLRETIYPSISTFSWPTALSQWRTNW